MNFISKTNKDAICVFNSYWTDEQFIRYNTNGKMIKNINLPLIKATIDRGNIVLRLPVSAEIWLNLAFELLASKYKSQDIMNELCHNSQEVTIMDIVNTDIMALAKIFEVHAGEVDMDVREAVVLTFSTILHRLGYRKGTPEYNTIDFYRDTLIEYFNY